MIYQYAIWRYMHYSPWGKLSYEQELNEQPVFFGQFAGGYGSVAIQNWISVRLHKYGHDCKFTCVKIVR